MARFPLSTPEKMKQGVPSRVSGGSTRRLGYFDVFENYNAKVDGKVVQDGAMASGSHTLVCTTSAPFASGDVGKYIEVQAAGASSVLLITTVAGFTDSGHVTLTAANASGGAVSGAQVVFGTDDTLAWRAARDDIAAAGSGIIFCSKPGMSILSTIAEAIFGQLGGKLVLPNIPSSNPYPYPIVGIEGPTPTNGQPFSEANVAAQGGVDNCGDALVLYAAGVDAQPEYSDGAGSYLGVISGGLTRGEFSNLCFHGKNFIIRTPAGSHYNGVDLDTVQQQVLRGVITDVQVPIQDQMTEPLADSVGFWTPGIANGAKTRLVNCFALGYGTGFTLNEWSSLEACGASFSRTGAVNLVGGGHSVWLGAHFQSQWNRHHVVAGVSQGPVSMGIWDIEDAPDGQWYSTVNHVADASNHITGQMPYARFKAGVGAQTGLTVSGGSHLTLIDLNSTS